MTSKKILGFVGAVIVIIVAIGLFSNVPIDTRPIRIGVLTPLTGDAAIYGESLKKGLDLAVEEINKDGVLNRKVELVYEDTHLDSKTAVSAFNKFINTDGLNIVIIAEGSGATSAVVPLADKTKTLVMIPLASADSLKDAGDYVFRIIPADNYRGQEIAKFAKTTGSISMAVLYVNDTYGVGLRDIISQSFLDLGGKIVAEEAFASGDIDYRGQLTKIKEANPDVIVIAARKEFPIIMKQKNNLGLKNKVIASEVIDDSILKTAGNDMAGVLTLDFAPATDYVNFKTNFKQKYDTDVPLYSDYGYDSLKIIIEAVEKTKSIDATKLKNTLYNIEYKGATGEIKFNSLGEVMEKIMIPLVVKNGQFVKLEE